MNKAEAIELINDYESDFEEISSILDDGELTKTQKLAEIESIISGSEDDETEEQE